MKYAFVLLQVLIFMGACAKARHSNVNQGLQVSDIPRGCSLVHEEGMPLVELHTFGANDRYASVFDCGMREGVHCYYYLFVSDSVGLPLEDYRCE